MNTRSFGNHRRPTNVRHARRGGAWGWVIDVWKQRTRGGTGETEDGEDRSHFTLGRVLVLGAAVVCLGLVGTAVANLDQYTARTQQFHVARFEVRGTHRAGRDSVIAATGVKPGSSLMAVDRLQVQRNLEQLPWVRRALVQQVLPSTLDIKILEYEPFALVLADRLLLVDRNGFAFKEAATGDGRDLTIITGLPAALQRDTTGLASGTPSQVRRRLLDLLRLLDHHARSALATRFPLSELHWDAALGVTLVSALDGAEVRLGRTPERNVPRTLEQLGRLLDRLDARGEWLRYALLDDDVRPDRAIVRAVPFQRPPHIEVAQPGGAAAAQLPAPATRTSGRAGMETNKQRAAGGAVAEPGLD
ncbi:MAG: FtsQ-type POTRA domain-containing protein [Myxococcales bacterium]|nr:FtsQ-type POTRA domain-containing protein [Myxococcales bacterium]